MKMQRLAIALTAVNLVLLLLIVARAAPTTAQAAAAPVLRGSALELVDGRGQVRSRIDVEANGEVVLRLLDRNGTIRVKLGAGENGSGLVLLDEATEPGVHLLARRAGTSERPATTSITVRGADGRQRVITPSGP
jgi:hypothetical protein